VSKAEQATPQRRTTEKEGVVNRDKGMSKTKLVRELGQGIVVLALGGTSVGSVLGMVALATHALGR
jgi:hypothetical protein